MTGLVAAELRKLWTVRTTWVLTAIGLALVVLTAGTQVFSRAFGPFTGDAGRTTAAIGEIGANSIIVLVVALLVVTTEFRHATIGRALLLTPSRARVLVAKLAAGATYAAAFFVASLALVIVLLSVRAGLEGVALEGSGEVLHVVWQGLVALGLTGLLGVAVGALVRSQVVAITGSLVWLFVVENLASALRPDVGRWLPFQALNAVFLPGDARMAEPGFVAPLPPGLALAVFLGYVVVATAAAGALLTVRDV